MFNFICWIHLIIWWLPIEGATKLWYININGPKWNFLILWMIENLRSRFTFIQCLISIKNCWTGFYIEFNCWSKTLFSIQDVKKDLTSVLVFGDLVLDIWCFTCFGPNFEIGRPFLDTSKFFMNFFGTMYSCDDIE